MSNMALRMATDFAETVQDSLSGKYEGLRDYLPDSDSRLVDVRMVGGNVELTIQRPAFGNNPQLFVLTLKPDSWRKKS